jgi:hypothetical protein
MNESQKLQLQGMIAANNSEDQTELIRKLKHSIVLRNETNTLLYLKSKYREDAEKLHLEAMHECKFLFTYYTDIYNKIRKDELNISLFHQFLDVLKEIEDGKLDQHEGSFKVGTILKEIYVDSALKRAEKVEKENSNNLNNLKNLKEEKKILNIDWNTFKRKLG